jgi:hypothetical protein
MSEFTPANNGKKKSFWERPEGNAGMVFLGLLGLGAFLVADKVLPFIIRVLQNTIYTVVLLGVLGAILYLVTNERFRRAVSALFQLAMRKLTGFVIEIDPIGILKNHIRNLEVKKETMEEHLGSLKGQITSLSRNISDSVGKATSYMERAESLKKRGGSPMEIELQARNAAREKSSAERLTVHKKKMDIMYTVLCKMRDQANYILENTKHEVMTQEREYKAVREAFGVMRSAKAIINGEISEREMFEETMQYLADDVAMRIGEMDNFMEMSKEVLSGVDADMGAMSDKGLKMLADWESKGSIYLSDDTSKIPSLSDLSGGTMVAKPVEVQVSSGATPGSKFLD